MRLTTAAGFLAIVLVTTTACGEGRPSRAVTVDPQESSAATVEDVEATEAAPASSAGGQLTKPELKVALLTVGDLPSGWSKSPSEDDSDDGEDTINPERCRDIFDQIFPDSKAAKDAAAEASADFNKGGPFGTILTESITSYDQEIDADKVQTLADSLSDCPKLSSTDSEGTVTKMTVSPLSFANLGDQTLALAMTAKQSGFTFALNVAFVVIGHNLVTMANGGLMGADGAQLEKFTRKAIKKLESSTS